MSCERRESSYGLNMLADISYSDHTGSERSSPAPSTHNLPDEFLQPILDPTAAAHSDTPASSDCSSPIPPNSSLNTSDTNGPMLYDPTLPPGWSRRVTQRTLGASAGKYDVYIFSPDKKKIRSKTDLILYLHRNNLDLDPNDFDFTVRGRGNTAPRKPPSPKKKPLNNTSAPANVSSNGCPFKNLTKALKSSNNQSSSSNAHTIKGITRENSESHLATTATNGPRLIVKFEFPVKRLKRSTSLKSRKKNKKKKKESISRQSSQDDDYDEMSRSNWTETFDNSNLSGTANSSHHQEMDINENSVPLPPGFGDTNRPVALGVNVDC